MAARTASGPARIAVVGCGGWTQNWHLPNLANREDAVIAALVDPSEQPGVAGCVPTLCTTMTELSAKYSCPKYTSIDALLADADALKLDGLLCAAPHRAHAAIGKQALKAGLHVLMEKPMTTDVVEARELLDASRATPEKCFLINNTANWQPGAVTAHDWVVGQNKLGDIKHVNSVFAAPLGWLFEGEAHKEWQQLSGSMKGNGFGWGQFSHTFAWIYKVTGLTPMRVYAVCTASKVTGADLFDALVVTCTNGATISASGVGSCPDNGSKVVGNWVFGSEGMLTYGGAAGSDNVENEEAAAAESAEAAATKGGSKRTYLEMWSNDGTHEVGPPFQFEHLDQGGTGPGSMDAFVAACRGETYFAGATALDGLKAVATIEAMYRSMHSGKAEDVADSCQ